MVIFTRVNKTGNFSQDIHSLNIKIICSLLRNINMDTNFADFERRKLESELILYYEKWFYFVSLTTPKL
jgi:hypothetical protein